MSRKRHHAKHLGFLFSWLITRRSAIQIRPPATKFLTFTSSLELSAKNEPAESCGQFHRPGSKIGASKDLALSFQSATLQRLEGAISARSELYELSSTGAVHRRCPSTIAPDGRSHFHYQWLETSQRSRRAKQGNRNEQRLHDFSGCG